MKTTGQAVFFITHSVEGACYLATSIIVVSPRPGRVPAAIRAPFSARGRAPLEWTMSGGWKKCVASSPGATPCAVVAIAATEATHPSSIRRSGFGTALDFETTSLLN